jgi:hypothetical protein
MDKLRKLYHIERRVLENSALKNLQYKAILRLQIFAILGSRQLGTVR